MADPIPPAERAGIRTLLIGMFAGMWFGSAIDRALGPGWLGWRGCIVNGAILACLGVIHARQVQHG